MKNNRRFTTDRSTFLIAPLIAVAALSLAADAAAWGPPPPLVGLRVINANPWIVTLQPSSAWSITVDMTVRERDILGIGVPQAPPFLPPRSTPGYLVFEDPDSCPSFIRFSFDSQELAYLSYYCPADVSSPLTYPGCTPPDWRPYLDYDCPSDITNGDDWFTLTEAIEAADPGLLKWAKDETWLEFSPGISVATWVSISDPNKEHGSQEVWSWRDDHWEPEYVGPNLGTVFDPIGFGRSTTLPGLVVIADHGPGLLTTPLDIENPPPLPDPSNRPTPSDFFDPTYPAEAWNLAGFFNSVTFTFLQNAEAPVGWGKLKLQAHLNVPTSLFTPVVLIDKVIDHPIEIDGYLCGSASNEAIYRLDGGPLRCLDELGIFYSFDSILNEVTVTVRVFIVDGDAPDIVGDMNGDGVIDIDDVRDMGYLPLSRERVFSFNQYHEIACESGAGYDFDGNGLVGGCVIAPRAGSITGVPR